MNEFRDWSQNGEQKFIESFFKNHPHGRFLDLGAYDGVEGSNTRWLSDNGWAGVCVEACAYTFEKLVKNHDQNQKIQCLNAAIAPPGKPAIMTFYDTQDMACTIYPDNHVGHTTRRKWFVATITPNDLWTAFGGNYEFVSVDIEGIDLPVINSMGCLLERTKLICFEDTIPGKLLEADYYGALMEAWKRHGFTKVIGRTSTREKNANTLLSRE